MIRAIYNDGICVTDMARSVAFYEKLSFMKALENDRGCTMVAGSAKLFLFQTRQEYPRALKRGLGLINNPPGLDHISFLVSDVDQIYSGLKANGVVFSNEPAARTGGGQSRVVKKPGQK